jgi:hypothetical protein
MELSYGQAGIVVSGVEAIVLQNYFAGSIAQH